MAKIIEVVVVDGELDFTVPAGKLPGRKSGALYVPGAYEDMQRGGKLLKKTKSIINDMHFTMDAHHVLHIAHKTMWKDRKGRMPDPKPPFDIVITNEGIRKGEWVPQIFGKVPGIIDPRTGQDFADFRDYTLYYTETLEAQKDQPTRNCLRLWTEHCLIGSSGADLHPDIEEAGDEWARHHKAIIDWIYKGSNWKTEHFSAMKADVIDPTDPTTGFRTQLAETLGRADEVWWLGEALDFCVANTMRDTYEFLGADALAKCVLLTDCTSAIFPALGDSFIKEMTAKGMRLAKSTDF